MAEKNKIISKVIEVDVETVFKYSDIPVEELIEYFQKVKALYPNGQLRVTVGTYTSYYDTTETKFEFILERDETDAEMADRLAKTKKAREAAAKAKKKKQENKKKAERELFLKLKKKYDMDNQ